MAHGGSESIGIGAAIPLEDEGEKERKGRKTAQYI